MQLSIENYNQNFNLMSWNYILLIHKISLFILLSQIITRYLNKVSYFIYYRLLNYSVFICNYLIRNSFWSFKFNIWDLGFKGCLFYCFKRLIMSSSQNFIYNINSLITQILYFFVNIFCLEKTKSTFTQKF